MRVRVALVAMAMAMATGVHAQDTGSILSTLAPGAANAAGGTIDISQVVIDVFQSNLPEDEPRLIVMRELPSAAELLAPKICGGLPGVIVNTKKFPSNNACFAQEMPTNSLSCSCLDGLTDGDVEWNFNIKIPEPITEALPGKIPNDTALGLSSMIIFGLPKTVKTVRFKGQGSVPVPMDIRKPPYPGVFSGIAMIQGSANTTVETIYVENLDLSTTTIKAGFLPQTVKSLTMKNCKLQKLPTEFLNDLDVLESLDVSSNQLDGVFQDITAEKCSSKTCTLKALNATDNRIQDFPSYVLSFTRLQSLSLRKNPFKNVSVSEDDYYLLKKLKTFEVDAAAQTCPAGNVSSVLSTSVCVLGVNAGAGDASPPASDTTTGSDSGNSNSYLMYGVIGGCLVIAILVFVLVKRNGCRRDDSSKEVYDGYFDNTLSYDDTNPSISATMLNDPIIITNRIRYKDIRVANCISKGGFGLVYSGVYNRRRVAIKKIRPDRAGDIKQIESFLKEICLMATLNHPRIVEFIGVSWDSLRNLCAVTEYMERGDLREVLHGFKLRNQRLTWEAHKTIIAMHIAEALTYLHSLSPKVIHRDLKSKNVLLNSDLHAKLSDFGISRERNFEETHMTAGIGTSFWIAPEVLLGKDYDERADIFSFGVVLSEIDTDDYPYWNGENQNANVGNKAQENLILQMVASGSMRPTFSDTCPSEILELANACLQVEPEDRPSAAQIVYSLQQMQQFSVPPSSEASSFSTIQ
ncbi:hypothetical protein Poli38472_006353 [Pythium oligandrum]|uniref:Protein kinase domain-containing protein n=1 Tax=Pythium oligandrum TaxID=41045 RepID=A0A8K1C4M5_PYTOL|nr:hypothetical protein Poli38472_006353 [Pythium oligandrum]|eukprot:TMW56343.1 hypothetical protein Poli38472_006353 [Pythium oligandrum]